MLTDAKLKALKTKEKAYKVADRDGMYIHVSAIGNKVFRFDYRFDGKRETLTIGKYGLMSLAEAREALIEARRALSQGISPSQEKQNKGKKVTGNTLGEWWTKYLAATELAPSTLKIKVNTYALDVQPRFDSTPLTEIKSIEIRSLCETITERGAPTTAIRVRDIFNSVYKYAILKGLDIHNPAAAIENKAFYRGKPRDKALKPKDIKIFFETLEESEIYPAAILAMKLLLLTMLRKSEVINAQWDEIDIPTKTWTIPAARMKARREHCVYLSDQVVAIFAELKVYAGKSDYILPARGNKNKPMAVSSINRASNKIIEAIQEHQKFESFVIHDFRRTASTILHEQGYNTDHIEKCLAHSDASIRGVYNKAQYEKERRLMMQQWADMLDEWIYK